MTINYAPHLFKIMVILKMRSGSSVPNKFPDAPAELRVLHGFPDFPDEALPAALAGSVAPLDTSGVHDPQSLLSPERILKVYGFRRLLA